MTVSPAKVFNIALVLGFYSILAVFSTTAFINELTSGILLDRIVGLR